MAHSDDARIAWGRKEEGDELFERGDFEGAIECYDKALELFPRDPEIWNIKGLALSKLKRYDEAIKSYDIGSRTLSQGDNCLDQQRCSSQQCGQANRSY